MRPAILATLRSWVTVVAFLAMAVLPTWIADGTPDPRNTVVFVVER